MDDRPWLFSDASFLWLIFITGAVLRLWGISKVHYWDEMVYLQNAQVICCGKTNYSELAFRPPLISLFFAVILKLWHSIYAVCVGTGLLNALAPVFLFLAGRLSLGRLPSLIASCLLAFSPFFIGIFPAGFISDDTGNSLLTDCPALTLITLSFWLLLRANARPSFFRFFCSGIALALCVLMRFGSLSCVGILLFLTLFSFPIWISAGSCLLGFVTGLVPYALWCSVRFGDPLFTLKQGWIHVEGPTEPFTFFVRDAPTIFGPIAIAGLALYLLSKFFPSVSHSLSRPTTPLKKDRPVNQYMEIYLLAWLLIAFLIFSRIPHKEPRYIMPAAPPFFLLSGLGLSLLFSLRQRYVRWACVGGLCASFIFASWPLLSRLSIPMIDVQVPDEERAAAVLSTTVPADTQLYMSYNYPALAYYTNFHIHELSNIGPALYRDMEHVPPGQVLVVYKDAEAPSQADTAWCDASHLFARIAEYPSLVVYRRLG